MDSVEGTLDRASQRLGQLGLSDSWNIFHENMAFRYERKKDQVDDFAFALDDGFDV